MSAKVRTDEDTTIMVLPPNCPFDAVVLANGEPPSASDLEQARTTSHLFICADGGANTAFTFGLRPDYVIGDLDSYQPSQALNLSPILDPDQETNDLEKALALALRLKCRSVLVLAATGRRLDHTLKNLSVLVRYHHDLDLVMQDASGYFKVIDHAILLRGVAGQTVSLVALSGRVDNIVTTGLRWPLLNETLQVGVRDGTSNELIQAEAKIAVGGGFLLVFLARAAPKIEGLDFGPIR